MGLVFSSLFCLPAVRASGSPREQGSSPCSVCKLVGVRTLSFHCCMERCLGLCRDNKHPLRWIILSMGLEGSMVTFPSCNSAMQHLCHGGDRCDLPWHNFDLKVCKMDTSLCLPSASIVIPAREIGVPQRTHFFLHFRCLPWCFSHNVPKHTIQKQVEASYTSNHEERESEVWSSCLVDSHVTIKRKCHYGFVWFSVSVLYFT